MDTRESFSFESNTIDFDIEENSNFEIEENKLLKDDSMEFIVKEKESVATKIFNLITLIPRFIFSIVLDLILILIAIPLVMLAICGVSFNFDPKKPKSKKTPILLLHGNGFNEIQWLIGRYYLNNDNYGDVYSLNYDGLLIFDPKMGIEDYSYGKVRSKILEICKQTKQKEVILIGHSMGGLIAACYAEYYAEEDGVTVKNIISIATPFHSAPLANHFYCQNEKRVLQMTHNNDFRKNLILKAEESEKNYVRNYYNINSTIDILAPTPNANLTKFRDRLKVVNYLGHYGIVVFPPVWYQINIWLDGIYSEL